MVDSGSVRRESQDTGLHELELLDDTVAQDASGWGAITVARAGGGGGALGKGAITVARSPREACAGNTEMPGLTSWGC